MPSLYWENNLNLQGILKRLGRSSIQQQQEVKLWQCQNDYHQPLRELVKSRNDALRDKARLTLVSLLVKISRRHTLTHSSLCVCPHPWSSYSLCCVSNRKEVQDFSYMKGSLSCQNWTLDFAVSKQQYEHQREAFVQKVCLPQTQSTVNLCPETQCSSLQMEAFFLSSSLWVHKRVQKCLLWL